MLSLAARSGPFAPCLAAAAHAVPGPLKPLAPALAPLAAKLPPLDPKRPFLCRESLQGQAARVGLVASAGINGYRASFGDENGCDYDAQQQLKPIEFFYSCERPIILTHRQYQQHFNIRVSPSDNMIRNQIRSHFNLPGMLYNLQNQ